MLAAAGGLGASVPVVVQKQAAEALCARAVTSKVVFDPEGNVTKLAISNHDASRQEKIQPLPEPLSAENFRRVVDLAKLEAIGLEMQQLGDAELALLGQLPELRDVRLHYMWGRKKGGTATEDAPLFINNLARPLRVLELKHNFSIEGGCMPKLKPQPELEKLELDLGYATNDAVPFIVAAPKLRNLQLHRTTISDERFQEVLAALPALEMLEVRPLGGGENPITGKSLRGLRANPRLQLVRLGMNWKQLPFEGGLDVFVDHPGIRYLVLEPSDPKAFTLDDPAIQELHAKRPDIRIVVRGKSLGGDGAPPTPNIDAEFAWDGGVTTHG